jgi:hypothetical protein
VGCAAYNHAPDKYRLWSLFPTAFPRPELGAVVWLHLFATEAFCAAQPVLRCGREGRGFVAAIKQPRFAREVLATLQKDHPRTAPRWVDDANQVGEEGVEGVARGGGSRKGLRGQGGGGAGGLRR